MLIIALDRAIGVEHVDQDFDLLADGDARQIGTDLGPHRAVTMAQCGAVLLEDDLAFRKIAVALGDGEKFIDDFLSIGEVGNRPPREKTFAARAAIEASACRASFCC